MSSAAASIVNAQSGTNVAEIAAGVYRISTPVPETDIPGGFTFNQFLLVDEQPLLFHTGQSKLFPLVHQAVAHVLGDVAKLRWVGFSHFEADECGSLNEWLSIAPEALPVCSMTAAMVSVNDTAIRPARALADGEELVIGKKRMRWIDAPHLPHNWECGYMFETTGRTLLCGDLFTHLGNKGAPVTETEVLSAAVAAHKVGMSGMGVEKNARAMLEKIASTEPLTMALMHGSSYRGNGAALLRGLADAIGA